MHIHCTRMLVAACVQSRIKSTIPNCFCEKESCILVSILKQPMSISTIPNEKTTRDIVSQNPSLAAKGVSYIQLGPAYLAIRTMF